MHHKYLPDLVDHKDQDKLNNNEGNLRDANRCVNNLNSGLRVDNTSGVRGVVWKPRNKKWQVRATVNGLRVSLGLFKTWMMPKWRTKLI